MYKYHVAIWFQYNYYLQSHQDCYIRNKLVYNDALMYSL